MRIRVIPCLQLADERLVKTVKFKIKFYIGDPVNTVKIFNDLEVDEMCFLDIQASSQRRTPDFNLLKQIADECFMPLSYGGGINNIEIAKKIFSIGFEKVVINTAAVKDPHIIKQLSEHYGSQAIIAAIDVKKNLFGKYDAFTNNGIQKVDINPVEWAQKMEKYGAGEILLTSIDRDGTWSGYDLNITKKISDALTIPVIANGGAGNVNHLSDVVKKANASAIGLGSMLIFQKKDMGVLINYPAKEFKMFSIPNQYKKN
jgi:cyclase